VLRRLGGLGGGWWESKRSLEGVGAGIDVRRFGVDISVYESFCCHHYSKSRQTLVSGPDQTCEPRKRNRNLAKRYSIKRNT
jgi:hypothetical protein